MPSKIKYLLNKDINYHKWDKSLSASLNPYIYAKSWYLDLVAEDWDALILGDYKIIMPLPFNTKYGIYYIHQPIFTQQLGIFSKSLLNKDIILEFIKSIPKKFKLIDINLNKYNKVESNEFEVFEKSNVELDLFNDYDFISKNYSSNHKRNLKKANKNDLIFTPHCEPEQLIELFKHNKGKEINVFTDRDYKRLTRLLYQLIYKGKGRIFGVNNDNNSLIAAAFFAYDFNRLIFLFSGQNSESMQKGGMHYLLDSVIKEFAGKKITLDFEGSNISGIKRFYLGFGSKEFKYNAIQKINTGIFGKLAIKLYKKLK